MPKLTLGDFIRMNFHERELCNPHLAPLVNSAHALWVERRALPPTEILPGLWMTGSAHLVQEIGRLGMDVVVNLSQYPDDFWKTLPGWDGLYLWWPIDDADIPDPNQLATVTALVQTALVRGTRTHTSGSVLVHCDAGVNRSGLVCALVASRVLGTSGAEAVALVRQKRPGSLTNPAFVAFLEGLR